MKFRIDLEVSPKELRQLLGLPDVEGLQQELLDKVREQVEAGTDGYDAATLLKPYLSGSVDQYQRLLTQMLNAYVAADKRKEDKG